MTKSMREYRGPYTREEIAAMFLLHEEYAKSAMGVVRFWSNISPHDKRFVLDMLKEIDAVDPLRQQGERRARRA